MHRPVIEALNAHGGEATRRDDAGGPNSSGTGESTNRRTSAVIAPAAPTKADAIQYRAASNFG